MLFRISIAALWLAAAASPALAQDNALVPPPESCRTEPQPANPADQGMVDPGKTGSTTLSDKLDDCNGVLKPPATGDQGITQPPPDTGRTRLIQPHELPEQQPDPQAK